MTSVQTVTLTQISWRVPPVIHAVQNDTGRILRMTIADQEIPSETTAELAILRSDGSYYTISCEQDAEYFNIFEADMTQALTQSGRTICQLKVDGIVSSYSFVIEVQESTNGVSVEQLGITPQDILDAADRVESAITEIETIIEELEVIDSRGF